MEILSDGDRNMKLSTIIAALDVTNHVNMQNDPEILDICCDSRFVRPGSFFFALSGSRAHGAQFVKQAIQQGAVAIACEQSIPLDSLGELFSVPVLQVSHGRRSMAAAAAIFFHKPAHAMTLLGVTGTNGKTTITYLAEAMLKAAGESSGVIGTVNYRTSQWVLPASHTTPESNVLHRILDDMRKDHVSTVVMEVSSHALAQERVHGLTFTSVAFTNLTRDHLDYHQNLENYFGAKRKLVMELCAGIVVANADDPYGNRLLEELEREGRTGWGFSTCGRAAEIWARGVACDIDGMTGTLVTPRGEAPFRTSLVGGHNLQNILAAAGMVLGAGFDWQAVIAGINSLEGIPGRLERVSRQGVPVFVDYAHTPDALARALVALRPHIEGRLIVVFGCGGERDLGKRALMGEAAVSGSDLTIVTSDNPRSEDPQAIIDQIIPGLCKAGADSVSWKEASSGARGWIQEVDRRKAIEMAIDLAREGDVVLLAGKGHENYQTIGQTKLPFDDREVALHQLEARL